FPRLVRDLAGKLGKQVELTLVGSSTELDKSLIERIIDPLTHLPLTPEGFLHVFPQIYDCEGFFVARLRKMSSLPAMPAPGYKVGA
ncbi:hypothetical protein MJL81_29085, partial [Salmonella enterica subsp. enterica serovar Anatum]|nr:hypothetical protein [Salmonella enterica subsp. enterica serovar Anatum]